MLMTLEVVSANGHALGDARTRRIQQQGVTIGRCPQRSEWVIDQADRSYVSRLHARVSFDNGNFHVIGLGTNPIAVYQQSNVVPNEQPCVLRLGDRFFVEDYAIEVVEAGPAMATPAPGSLAELVSPSGDEPQPGSVSPGAAASPLRVPENLDEWIGPIPDPEEPHEVAAREPQVSPPSVPSESGQAAPRSNASAVAIPASAPPTVAPKEEPRGAQLHPEQIRTLEDLLRAVNVDPASVPRAVTDNLGKMILIGVQGIVDLLQGRSTIKYEGGVCGTIVMPIKNNALKLSPDALAAIQTLLVQSGPGFLAPPAALEQAMDDLRHHQIIVINAMRAAFTMLLESFDPQHLKEEFGVSPRGGLLNILEKARFHDRYVEHFASMKDNSDALFKRCFAAAYEQQESGMRSAARPREVAVPLPGVPPKKDQVTV